MAPKLYSIAPGAPSRAVFMCARALGIELEIIPVSLAAREQFSEDFLKKNPQHTVPVLEDDDGFIVIDSHAIMGYLVAKYGKDDSLYPKDDYKQRAIIDHRLHFETGFLFPRGANLARPLIHANKQPTQENMDALKEAFQILEELLVNSKTDFIAGNNLSIADFSIYSSASCWNIFLSMTDYPNLKAYLERLEKIPCFEANREGVTILRGLISGKLQK